MEAYHIYSPLWFRHPHGHRKNQFLCPSHGCLQLVCWTWNHCLIPNFQYFLQPTYGSHATEGPRQSWNYASLALHSDFRITVIVFFIEPYSVTFGPLILKTTNFFQILEKDAKYFCLLSWKRLNLFFLPDRWYCT